MTTYTNSHDHNGSEPRSTSVRVAIAGIGNCASSLIQGVHYYAAASGDEPVPGLMHHTVGGYHVSDIEFVAAFDVDVEKVGHDLGEAIWRGQNNTVRFAEVPELAPSSGDLEAEALARNAVNLFRQVVELSPMLPDELLLLPDEHAARSRATATATPPAVAACRLRRDCIAVPPV